MITKGYRCGRLGLCTLLAVGAVGFGSHAAAQAPVTLDEVSRCGYYHGARAMGGDGTGTWIHAWPSETVRVSRSTDDGTTWGEADTIQEPWFGGGGFVDGSVHHNGMALASGGSGLWMLAVSRMGYFNNSCLCSPTCSGSEGEYDKGAHRDAATASVGDLKCEEWEEYDSQVYVSTDDGLTWTHRALPLGEYDAVVLERVYHRGGKRWYILARDVYSWAPMLMMSEDDGLTWTRPTNLHAEGMGFGGLLAAGHDGFDAFVVLVREEFQLDSEQRFAVSALSSRDAFETVEWQRLFTFATGADSGSAQVTDRPHAAVHLGGARWLATWTREASSGQPGLLMGARSLDHGRTWSQPFDLGPGALEGIIAGNGAGGGMLLLRLSGPGGQFGYARFGEPRFQLDPVVALAGSVDDRSVASSHPLLVHRSSQWMGSWSLYDRPLCHTRMRAVGIADVDPAPGPHSLDVNGDRVVDLGELLRAIQLYNSSGYHCSTEEAEDGYAPEAREDAQACAPHTGDYAPQNWRIGLGELLRMIQFYNVGGYRGAEVGEDGFAPGFDAGA